MAIDDKYVIRPHRPFRSVIRIISLVLVAAVALWLWVNYLGQSPTKIAEENRQLERTVQEITQRYQTLNEAYTASQQTEVMNQAKTAQLENRLEQLQQRVIELDKELLFYQNITQGGSSSELQVRELQLRPDPENTTLIRYRLVITQGENIREPITGKVNVDAFFSPDEPNTSTRIGEYDLNLRHVQVIEGAFETVSNVVPSIIQVQLVRADKVLVTHRVETAPLITSGP